MPTTCVVVGCNNRKSKQSHVSFYRFPNRKEEEERRLKWIAFVSRKNSDGSAWKPSKGSRLCSDHFITGKKSDKCTNPDYIPSVKANTSPTPTECNAALSRFQRASRREKLQTERRRQEERDVLNLRRVDEEKEEMIRRSVCAFNNDHAYTCHQVQNSEEAREEPRMEDCISVQQVEIDIPPDLQPVSCPVHSVTTDCCIPAEIGMVILLTWT